ncbi:MAG: exonuclease domain-containing protein, partial [Pirellula sp.]
STCQIYDIAMQPVDLQCTRLISKRTFTSLRSHALANVAQHLGVQFRHHDALEDARTSATILMRAAEQLGVEDLDQLEDQLGLIRGRVWTDRIRQPRTVRRSRMESTVAEPEPRYEPRSFRIDGVPTRSAAVRQSRLRADEILSHSKDTKPLSGKNVVLIHNLLGLDREDSLSFLCQLGATVQSHLNLSTHYLILGVPLASENASETDTSPPLTLARDTNPLERNLEEVSRRQNEGQPVRIISQRQLLAMIPSGLATARGDV